MCKNTFSRCYVKCGLTIIEKPSERKDWWHSIFVYTILRDLHPLKSVILAEDKTEAILKDDIRHPPSLCLDAINVRTVQVSQQRQIDTRRPPFGGELHKMIFLLPLQPSQHSQPDTNINKQTHTYTCTWDRQKSDIWKIGPCVASFHLQLKCTALRRNNFLPPNRLFQWIQGRDEAERATAMHSERDKMESETTNGRRSGEKVIEFVSAFPSFWLHIHTFFFLPPESEGGVFFPLRTQRVENVDHSLQEAEEETEAYGWSSNF